MDYTEDFSFRHARPHPLLHAAQADIAELGGALWSAARYQSIENAPLLVFATVGAVLTVFMLKS